MVGAILVFLGFVIAFVGGIMMLVAAFRQSILWGLVCFFFPFPAVLVFLIMFWDKAKKPFFIELVGLAIMVVGSFMGGSELITNQLPH